MGDRRVACMLGLAMTLATCSGQKELPAGPDEITTGLIIYQDANYKGESAHVTSAIRDLRDFKGPCAHDEGDTFIEDWNDCISSIRIGTGWRAMVYTNPDYGGRSLAITGDVSNLQLAPGDCDHEGMNDCISSISLLPIN
jgi:hypothetical protein